MTTETPAVKTETAPVVAAPAPQINVDEMVSRVAEQAARAATDAANASVDKKVADRLRTVGQALAGESPIDPNQQILNGFVNNPVEFARTIHNEAVKTVRQEINDKENRKADERAVLNPLMEEYPGLKTPGKLKIVQKFTEDYKREGMSHADAVKAAANDTIKEFGLEKVSEAQRNSAAHYAGLPGSGGSGFGAPKVDAATSNKSFVDGMKNRMVASRTKRTS